MDAIVKKIHRDASLDPKRPNLEEVHAAVRTLLAWAGDNPDREGLLDTPGRVAKAFREYFSGYAEDPVAVLSRTFEDVGGYDDIVMLRDIEFNSHCEHHIAPFIGRAHVAYLPTKAVVGISKLARVVEIQQISTAIFSGGVDHIGVFKVLRSLLLNDFCQPLCQANSYMATL